MCTASDQGQSLRVRCLMRESMLGLPAQHSQQGQRRHVKQCSYYCYSGVILLQTRGCMQLRRACVLHAQRRVNACLVVLGAPCQLGKFL